jgi:hypothetical protein
MRLRIVLWFGVVLYNAFSGIIGTQLLPGADRYVRILTAGGDIVMIGLALVSLFPHRSFYGVRLFGAFLLSALITVLVNAETLGLVSQLSALRQPLFFFSTLIAAYDIFQSRHRERFLWWFTAFLVLFAIAQIPTSIVQYARYGPGDEVGGTYGLRGGSGYVTQLLFLIVFYLLARHGSLRGGMQFSLPKLLLFSVLLVPCVLNETKISFLLLPALLLLMLETRRVYRLVPLLMFGGLLLYGLYTYYDTAVGGASILLDERFLERYLLYDRRQNVDIPRFQKIMLMFQLFGKHIWSSIVGMGYGLFAGGHLIETTRASRSLSYFGGSRGLVLTVWLQGGVIALSVVVSTIFTYLRPLASLTSTSRRFALFLAFSLVAMLFYNEAMFDRTYASIVSVMMLWVYVGGQETGEESEEDAEPLTGEQPDQPVADTYATSPHR